MLPDAKILATLQKLGLSYYGAKVYATLVATGDTTATVLSTESAVPRTKIYDVLKRLEEKKWITVTQGRPIIYSPRYPKEVLEERSAALRSEIDHCSNELALLHDRQIGKESQKVWFIRGNENISAKILEMIDRARHSVIMMGGTLPFSLAEIERLGKKITKAKKKDVTVRIVTSPKLFLKEGRVDVRNVFPSLVSDIRLFPPLPDDDHPASWVSLYIDRKEILMMIEMVEAGIPDLKSAMAMWIPNATVARYLMNMNDFDGLWEKVALLKPEPESKEEVGGSSASAHLYKDTFTEEMLRKEGLKERQIKAVMWVKEKGSVTNGEYRQITGLSHDGAFRDLRDLVEKGILNVSGKGRSVHYELA